VGSPLIFIAVIGAHCDGMPPNWIDTASALIDAGRNTGGSIGASIASNVLAHWE
jgi:DHA2 family multidrug resistance protein